MSFPFSFSGLNQNARDTISSTEKIKEDNFDYSEIDYCVGYSNTDDYGENTIFTGNYEDDSKYFNEETEGFDING